MEKTNFIQHPKKSVEAAVMNPSNISAFAEYINKFWLLPSHQVMLLEPGFEELRGMYIAKRRPCKEFVEKVLKDFSDNKELVRSTIIGCELSEDNEALLITTKYLDVIEEYIKECPAGPFFYDSTFDVAEEIGILEQIEAIQDKYNYETYRADAKTLGTLCPELAKLALA